MKAIDVEVQRMDLLQEKVRAWHHDPALFGKIIFWSDGTWACVDSSYAGEHGYNPIKVVDMVGVEFLLEEEENPVCSDEEALEEEIYFFFREHRIYEKE